MVGWSVRGDRVENRKMRISSPAHPSATDGRVSGLVFFFSSFSFLLFLFLPLLPLLLLNTVTVTAKQPIIVLELPCPFSATGRNFRFHARASLGLTKRSPVVGLDNC